MRNPNGYGSIKKLSGNRRRPYIFVISENGKRRVIGYYETQVEALTDIRFHHLQMVVDDMSRIGLSYSSRKKVRSLITMLFDYARRIEYTDRDFRGLLNIGKNKSVRPHHPFSRQKINRLWKDNGPGTDTVLILIYTGMRVSEMLHLQKSDVNRRQKYLDIRQSKTVSGIRIIPIHPLILPLIEARMALPGNTLIADPDGNPYSYSRYCTLWNAVMQRIHGEKHTTHDCRHTLATLMDNADVNENAKRRILGHAGGDVTDSVYTHKNLRQLRKAIMRIR